MNSNVHTCDACGAEACGFTKSELHHHGWRFHAISHGRSFAMCGACEARFNSRREQPGRPSSS